MGDAAAVAPNLFVGGLKSTYDWECLREMGVTHVVTLADEVRPFLPPSVQRLSVPLLDSEFANLVAFLPTIVEFVTRAWADQGVVLMHSAFGYSRCVAAAIGVVMVKTGCGMHEASASIRESLGHCEPNVQFLRQLEYAHRTGSLARMTETTSAAQVLDEVAAADLAEQGMFTASGPEDLAGLMSGMSVGDPGQQMMELGLGHLRLDGQ